MAELLTVTAELDTKGAREELERIEDRLDPNVLEPLVARSALDEVRESYQAQRDPDGNPWPGESAEYLRQKARRWGSKPMLHASERLWSSLGFTDEGEVGSINDPGYAAAVNAIREFLGVGETWLGRADEAILEYVDTGEGLPI